MVNTYNLGATTPEWEQAKVLREIIAELNTHNGTYASIPDTLSLRRLATLAATDAATSVAASRIAYDDNAATTESWANTSSWTLGANPTQVSAGFLYAGASQGGGSGMNRAWSLGTTGIGRAVFTAVIPTATGGGGGLMIGVSTDTAAATPTAGGGKARALYFSQSAGQVQSYDQGTGTNLAAIVAGTYVVTITADANYLTITATKTDGSQEYRAKWTRGTYSINNLFIFNSDSRTTSGNAAGPGGWRSALATISPRTGIEGVGQTVHWTSISSGTVGVRIALPAGYDSRKPAPLAICFHGSNSDETHWSTNSNGRAVANALTSAGYVALGVGYTANGATWGAQASLDAYYAAYQYVRDNYAIGPVVFYANSMGGIESLLTLAERRIPGVVAWVGTSPTGSLANAYADPGAQGFTALINTAYGIPGGGTYAAQTAGHDPALKPGYAFRGLPMLFLAATDDTAVPKAANTDVMAALVTPYSPIVTIQTGITGGHSFGFSPYAAQITSFFDTYSKG